MIELLGGSEKLTAKLDAMFDQKVDPAMYANVEDISGMIGQYIHGNEPSHHLPYLYMYAGAPLKTQARLKQIVDSQYKPSPDGLVGNDDLGQMSAWLVFTSLGFYPVAPGSNEYVLGRPFVDRAVLHLPNGKVLNSRDCELERVAGLCKRRVAEWQLARSQLRDTRGIDEGWRIEVHLQYRKGCRVVSSQIARTLLGDRNPLVQYQLSGCSAVCVRLLANP